MKNYWATKEIMTFDAEGYINEVFDKYAGTPNEESREDMQQLFDKVLNMPRGGDASLYPNAHGPRPALLEVWHKAGDFWRANGFSKPARLLCDQNGIVIDEKTAQRIAAAKTAINNATTATEATENVQDAQTDASEAITQPASDMPVQVTETATATAAPFSVCDSSTVAPQAAVSDLASESASDTADYDPDVIVPEATPSPTPRSRRTRRTRTTTTQPSLFDDCEITESSEAPAETTADDEKVTDGNAFLNALKEIADNKTAREIAKGVGILAAVLIIYECGLIIPFALLGGLAGGLIK